MWEMGDCVRALLGLLGLRTFEVSHLITGVGAWNGSRLHGCLVGLDWIIESQKG